MLLNYLIWEVSTVRLFEKLNKVDIAILIWLWLFCFGLNHTCWLANYYEILSSHQGGEKKEFYFHCSRDWFQARGLRQSRGCMTCACCTVLSPSYTHDHSSRWKMIPWKTTAPHLLLHLTGLQAQETAHLLTLASLHLMFSSASQVIQALIAVFIILASEETWRKQGGKDRRHPRRAARKATQMKGCKAYFPEGRNSHIH